MNMYQQPHTQWAHEPQPYPYIPNPLAPPAPPAPLEPRDISLQIRQQPQVALLAIEGKEKTRKPVDPPPIIQMHVSANAEQSQHFQQSPYLFMCADLVRADNKIMVNEEAGKSLLAGSLVSSIHRLKDTDNKNGGFFVWGDISVKTLGTFRLQFSLFDLRPSSNQVQFLCSTISEPFQVQPQKDFQGMNESTYLSRAFSDQGVKLRLRKEPRALVGKRTYEEDNEDASIKRPRQEPQYAPPFMSEYVAAPPTYPSWWYGG